MKENRDFKGVWIPKEIWLNTDLSIIEKVLLVEIDSLDNSERGCFASNEYLASFVQLSEGRVANIISDLKKRKFIIQVFFDGRNRGLRISKSESSFNENVKPDLTKTGKQNPRKREHNNTMNNTDNNTIISSKNSKEFCQNEKDIYFEDLEEFPIFPSVEIKSVSVKKNEKKKVNPFTIVAEVQKEKEKTFAPQKEKGEATERKPNPTYEAFTIFCQTFEQLSGANYPTDQNGNYLMNPKDAGGMVYLMKNIEKVDRTDNSIEALKVFVTAAWNLNDKWIRANFTPNTLYGQFSKIFTGYQTSSPEMIEKKKNDRIAELLAEKMKQYENQ
jgi:hypothetical protein